MHISLLTQNVRFTKCDYHKTYFSQTAQKSYLSFVQVVKYTKRIFHKNRH